MAKPPTTDAGRKKAFEAERARRRRAKVKIQADTFAEVERLLRASQAAIETALGATPSEWQVHHFENLKRVTAETLAEFEAAAGAATRAGLNASWAAGQALLDAPLAAAGIPISGMLPHLDPRQLLAMRAFMTDRISDVSTTLVNKINGELGTVLMGGKTPGQAAGEIAKRLKTGGRSRALSIVRTELGTAFSVATQERQDQAAEILPGLEKQWRRSGKTHSRMTHDLADGQTVKTDQPFEVGGHKLMHPRDPAAPVGERVNCGCDSLPHMANWEVRHPGAKPFSADELAASPVKRRLAQVQATAFDNWVKRLTRRTAHAKGAWETAGEIPRQVLDKLTLRGLAPATAEIGITDRRVLHMLRDAKAQTGKALPAREVRRLPEHIERPTAVLLDTRAKSPTLVYVFEVPGETRLGKLVVKLRSSSKGARQRAHNWVSTAGLVDRTTLADLKTYEILSGGL